jgi:hypothetical protein
MPSRCYSPSSPDGYENSPGLAQVKIVQCVDSGFERETMTAWYE